MYYDADDVMYNEVDEVKEDDKCNHGVDYKLEDDKVDGERENDEDNKKWR